MQEFNEQVSLTTETTKELTCAEQWAQDYISKYLDEMLKIPLSKRRSMAEIILI